MKNNKETSFSLLFDNEKAISKNEMNATRGGFCVDMHLGTVLPSGSCEDLSIGFGAKVRV